MCKLFVRKWGIRIHPDEIRDCHRTSNPKIIILRFDSKKPGSAFNRLMHRKGNWRGEKSIHLEVFQMLADNERRIKAALTYLKQNNAISSFRVQDSGRLAYNVKKGDPFTPVTDINDLNGLMDSDAMEALADYDRKLNGELAPKNKGGTFIKTAAVKKRKRKADLRRAILATETRIAYNEARGIDTNDDLFRNGPNYMPIDYAGGVIDIKGIKY